MVPLAWLNRFACTELDMSGLNFNKHTIRQCPEPLRNDSKICSQSDKG